MEKEKKAVTKCTTHGWHEGVVAGRCELCQAITMGNVEGVRRWLTPENMESTGRKGWTPLVFACRSNQVEIVKFLISAGANVNAVDKKQWNMLHHVDDYEIAEILLEHGVDVNYRGSYGQTPLHVSATKHPDIVRLLLESGADVFAVDTVGRTVLPKYHYDAPQSSLLLEYFGDATVRCKRVGCRCNITVLMCSYCKANRPAIGMYDRFIMKMMTAGVNLSDSNQLVEPRRYPLGNYITQLEAFHLECAAELERMATEKVPNSNVTYLSIFQQRPLVLRSPTVQQTLTPDHCNRTFPIYGETLRRRFVIGLREMNLLDRAEESFQVHVPQLLPECVSEILSYVVVEDLKNLLIACEGREYLRKLNQLPASRIIEKNLQNVPDIH